MSDAELAAVDELAARLAITRASVIRMAVIEKVQSAGIQVGRKDGEK